MKNSQPFVKKNEKMSGPLGGGIFLTHTVQKKLINVINAESTFIASNTSKQWRRQLWGTGARAPSTSN